MLKSKNALLALAAVLALSATAAFGIAQAASLGEDADVATRTPTPEPDPVTRVDPDYVKEFNVFDDSTATASLPAKAEQQLARVDPVLAVHGNLDLAAVVPNRATPGSVIVIPGDQNLCLFVPDEEGGYGGTCTTEAEALAGHASVTVGDTTVTLVPDDVSVVTATNARGEVSRASVRANLAINELPDPTELKLDDEVYSLTNN